MSSEILMLYLKEMWGSNPSNQLEDTFYSGDYMRELSEAKIVVAIFREITNQPGISKTKMIFTLL